MQIYVNLFAIYFAFVMKKDYLRQFPISKSSISYPLRACLLRPLRTEKVRSYLLMSLEDAALLFRV